MTGIIEPLPHRLEFGLQWLEVVPGHWVVQKNLIDNAKSMTETDVKSRPESN